MNNAKQLFQLFAKQRNINNPNDWYGITSSSIKDKRIKGLLRERYGGSLKRALQDLFPEQDWKSWLFERVPTSFWSEKLHQREYFDWLATEFQLRSFSDWYRIKVADVLKRGGRGVLKYHDNSLMNSLKSIYPEYNWHLWLFSYAPRGHWESDSNMISYLRWMASELHLEDCEITYCAYSTLNRDKYRKHTYPSSISPRLFHLISTQQFGRMKGGWLLKRIHGIQSLFDHLLLNEQQQHGEHDHRRESQVEFLAWDSSDSARSSSLTPYSRSMSKSQIYVYNLLRNVLCLGNQAIMVNQGHSTFASSIPGTKLEFDFFMPSVHLAIEYQGEQHFHWTNLHGSPEERQKNDVHKREACMLIGVTLIEIPYYWEASYRALQLIILEHRPDLVSIMTDLKDKQLLGNQIPYYKQPPNFKGNCNIAIDCQLIQKWVKSEFKP